MEHEELGRSLARRVAIRDAQLGAITAAARRYDAAALHVFGSVGRGTADALSDLDVWLTFPDAALEGTLRNRWSLYGEIGDVLLAHEMMPNRPPGGAYTLVLYASSAGPLQVDWYLAPMTSSRIDSSAQTVFADVTLPLGDLPTDGVAEHPTSRSERIDWLACMLFVAIKAVVRSDSADFLHFLGGAYRRICTTYGFVACPVSDPASLDAVGAMLEQLDRYGDQRQRRALRAIRDFQQQLNSS